MAVRMGGAGESWGAMRSFRRDKSVIKHQLPKGIVRRVGRFARP
ncbi:MAG: hypothetical protein ACYDBS_04415 [Acidimicrobiales bacterium]